MSEVAPSIGHHVPAVPPPSLSAGRRQECSENKMVLSKGFAPGKGQLNRIPDFSSAKTKSQFLFSPLPVCYISLFSHVLHLIFGGMAASVFESLILSQRPINIKLWWRLFITAINLHLHHCCVAVGKN